VNRAALGPIVKDLALEWVTPHVFPHPLATALRDAGYDPNAIARMLGHSDQRSGMAATIVAVCSPVSRLLAGLRVRARGA
jgi:integrase